MEELQKSVVYLLMIQFLKLNEKIDYCQYAIKLENELFTQLSLTNYLKYVNNIDKILYKQIGFFPNDIIIYQYLKNQDSDVITLLNKGINTTFSYREIIIQKFISLLFKSNFDFKKDSIRTFNIAKSIEKSCYNAVIMKCKQSEEPLCRKWTSPIFLDLYSNKCGIICNLLDIDSITYKTYHPTLLHDIYTNNINLSQLGFMLEKTLCPQSIKKEKEEIELRIGQCVKEKESNLFKCPKCKERKTTYKEVQLRALDEAPDYICRCLNCGNNFKG